MEPSLSADPNTIVNWCRDKLPPTHFYTERLGLPQTEKSKERGRPKFEGQGASKCRDLYRMVQQEARRVADRYHTKEDLVSAIVQQQNLSIAKTTEPLLDEHGPVIWSTFEPYVTRVREREYPQHLRYYDENDRKKIMLYLYCWIIGRVRRMQIDRRSHGHPSLDDDADETANGDDSSADTNEHIETLDNSVHGSDQAHTSPTRNPQIPTAQMLPVRCNTITTAARLPSGSSNARRSSFATAPEDEEVNLEEDNDESGSFQPGQPINLKKTGIKRRGYSTLHGNGNSNKKSRVDKQSSSRQPPTLSTRQRSRTGIDAEEDVEVSSYLSPPLIQHGSLDNVHNVRNFPNVPLSGRAVRSVQNDVVATSNSGRNETEAMAGNQHYQPDPALSVNEHDTVVVDVQSDQDLENEDDSDSVQGAEIPRVGTGPSMTTASIAQRHVVAIKLTAQSEEIKGLRRRLANRLGNILLAKLSQPNTLRLSTTIKMLEDLMKAEHLQLREQYGDAFNHYQGAIQQWLQWLKRLLEFYEIAGFTGDLSARDEFLLGMPSGPPDKVMEIFFGGRADLDDWRSERKGSERDLAKDVASIFFYVAIWDAWVPLSKVEHMTMGFTEELLAWFE